MCDVLTATLQPHPRRLRCCPHSHPPKAPVSLLSAVAVRGCQSCVSSECRKCAVQVCYPSDILVCHHTLRLAAMPRIHDMLPTTLQPHPSPYDAASIHSYPSLPQHSIHLAHHHRLSCSHRLNCFMTHPKIHTLHPSPASPCFPTSCRSLTLTLGTHLFTSSRSRSVASKPSEGATASVVYMAMEA